MVKRRERFSGVHYAVFALILMITLTGGARLTGMAVGEQPIDLKNLEGQWDIEESTDASLCFAQALAPFKYPAVLKEEDSYLTIFLPGYLVAAQGESTKRQAFNMTGPLSGGKWFINYKGAIFEISGREARVREVDTSFSSDCNSLISNIKWEWSDGKYSCPGTTILKASSNDKKGCFAPECKESWICPEFGACLNDTRTRECSDVNRCGTTKEKPAETQTCVSPIPVPAPKKSYLSMILLIALFLMAISAVASTAVVEQKKKKFSDQLEELVKSIRKSLFNEDLSEAVNGYKVLTEQFSASQKKLAKKDAGRIYQESLEIYADIVRLQAQKSAPIAA